MLLAAPVVFLHGDIDSNPHDINEIENQMQRQYVVKLDDYDQRIMIRALNDLRSTLIKEERPTDAVDELMVKVYGAKKKLLVSEQRSDYECR